MMLVLLACTNDICARECSYPLDMLRNFGGEAICQGCYEDSGVGEESWTDLPIIYPSDLTFYFPGQEPS